MPDIIITPSSGIIDFFPVSARVGRIEGSGNTINIVNPSGFVAVSGSGLSINASSPNATFHAYSAVSGATLLNLEGTNGSLFSVVDNLSGTLMSVNNNAGLPVFEVFSDDRVVAGRFGQNDFIMTSGGNIGIGTGVPSSKFHVVGTSTFNGDVSSTGSFIAGSGSAALPSFEFINDVDTGLFSPATNTFGISTSGVERLRIDSVGRVGIGTSSPSSTLQVSGLITADSGNFTQSLQVNGTGVSISGHTHTSSDISNFNSSVSGVVSGIYAPLSSPALIGTPTAPTASSGTNTTQIASTAFVRTEISNLVASAPTTLDTLNELATALGNDANFSTTVTTNLAGKANLSGATFTGSVSGPSGNFTSLKVNSVDVSAVGHTHTSSNITDFNSSVSGLLPTIANSGDNRVLTSTGGSVGVNAESNLTFNGSLLNVTGSGLFSGDVRTSGSFIGGSGTAALPSFEFTGDPDTGLFSPSANTIALATSGVERLRVNNNGQVGINTTNFNFYDVDNNVSTPAVSISGNLLIQTAIDFYTPNEANQYQRGRITSAGDAIFNTFGVGEKQDLFGNAVVMNTNGLIVNNGGGLGGSACQLLPDYGAIIENILIVNSNANGNAAIGIGTSTPSEALQVVGNIVCDNIIPSDPGTTALRVGSPAAYIDLIDNAYIYGDGELALRYSINNGGFVRIVDVDSNISALTVINNNIGIGTSTPSGALHVVGTSLLDDLHIAKRYTETVAAISISSNTLTVNLNTCNLFTCSLNANITTLTISNTPATSGRAIGFTLIFTADGTARSVTWPASVKWAGGTAPTLTSVNTKRDVLSFLSTDNGTTWLGFVGGQNY